MNPKHQGNMLLEKGRTIHGSCYPFGSESNYLDAASAFGEARDIFRQMGDNRMVAIAGCGFHDCKAVHEYYHTENYALAAEEYERALGHAREILTLSNAEERATWLDACYFFEAVSIECRAFVDKATGRFDSAFKRIRLAMAAYRAGLSCARANQDVVNERLLLHSLWGLAGEFYHVWGLSAMNKNVWTSAERSFLRALRYYNRALEYNPLWANSGVSDDYHRWTGDVRQLLTRLKEQRLRENS